jgi:hypothetical protein
MIQALRLAVTVQLDKNRITEITTRLGPGAADDVISRTMEELAVQLAKVHSAVKQGLTHEAQVAAWKIAEFSAHIGMPSLSAAAITVAEVSSGNCGVALVATAARLDRIGEASLMQVWDLQDLSM